MVKSLTQSWIKNNSGDIQSKLRELKNLTKVRNKEVNCDINEKITLLEKKQFKEDELSLDDETKTMTRVNLQKSYELRAKMLSQKARVKWQIEGDKKSRFFHNWIKFRWSKSQITRLISNNQWLTQPRQISDAFFNCWT